MRTLAEALEHYRSQLQGKDGEQEYLAARCSQVLRTDADCFERSNLNGHFTGSALIVDDLSGKTLLCHHVKYDRWVQTGGHCDGITDPFFTAWEEAYQETGLKDIRPLAPWDIADIDIIRIEAYRDVPAHWHYDIRYVFSASSLSPVVVSDESNDVRWVDVGDLRQLSDDAGLIRLVERHFGTGSVR